MKKIMSIILILYLVLSVLSGCVKIPDKQTTDENILRFESEQELLDAFKETASRDNYYGFGAKSGMVLESALDTAAPTSSGESRDFSETNIQVKGVDEADIIKTDGDYIYAVANDHLIIVKADPEAEILSKTKLDNFIPQEIFIHGDNLLIFGRSNHEVVYGKIAVEEDGYFYSDPWVYTVSVKLFSTENKVEPELLRTVEFEGSYITSRKINDNAYFVINSYPHYKYEEPVDIIPLYREDDQDFEPVAQATDIGYIKPLNAENFITVASISMTDKDKEVEKEVIVGSGENVYSSLENLYIAQTTYPWHNNVGEIAEDFEEKTIITKFNLDNGNIKFQTTGEVKGYILNQFSMDEYDNHFRIATTLGKVWDTKELSTNNVYVLDEDMELVGSLEDLAPGEKIYSVRFMSKKGYVVTFKKVDPLFVIDLEDHENPKVLGKLKIPGYSDYLHPYDDTHIIGIGKDTIEAEESLKEQREMDFAWYSGVKMAIFDVSDVENPIEMHKVIIGDRGTYSPVLNDHKALLFDKEKNLMVLPMTVAEVKGELFNEYGNPNHGDIVFQGAYVYDISLENGFELRDKISHIQDESEYLKSGYYFRSNSEILRSLYIENTLYTFSNAMIKLNKLGTLEEVKTLNFGFTQKIEDYSILR